jgi:hypothetical protein
MLDLDRLTTYLDDHLAGAQAALALIGRLEPDPSDGLDLEALHREIDADREVLAGLLEACGAEPSRVKRAAGWIAEKLSRPKLADGDALGRFEALELLGLGILGKRALWRALAAVRGGEPRLEALALEELEERAVAQHARVERARLASVRRAFRDEPARRPAAQPERSHRRL